MVHHTRLPSEGVARSLPALGTPMAGRDRLALVWAALESRIGPLSTVSDRPELTIVIPAFCEEGVLEELVEALIEVLDCVADYELLFIDDGSTDNTWAELTRLAEKHSQLSALRLSRRFGKEAAVFAGLEQAGGRAVLVMDGDLQHPPALIPKLVDLWRDGADVAEAVKRERGRESVGRRWAARVFYFASSRLAGLDLQRTTDFKLLDRRVVDHLVSLQERGMYLRGLVAWLGFRRESIPFDVPPRETGSSAWDVMSLMSYALTAIVSFSTIPLRVVTIFGVLFLLSSLLLAGQTLYVWSQGDAVSGFATVILLQLITGSLILMGLGVLGEYIARIYIEVKQRPRFLHAGSVGPLFADRTGSADDEPTAHE